MSGRANIRVLGSSAEMGIAAAKQARDLIGDAIGRSERARILIATGNSQVSPIDALIECKDIDWDLVEVFHMDEYIGLSRDHPASFRRWVRTRLADRVHPARVNYLAGDAADLDAEIQRYATLLNAAPIDLAFVGFGENGHIAFNDPPVADFQDPATVKRVALDEACRRQQAGEGHFPNLDSVPQEALTVTCPGLFRAASWICCVPEARKAEAVRNALEGPISTACPASLVREHPSATVYLDVESAALLNAQETGGPKRP
ncbi:MAG: glucosamine-6-phosphate deaminase [Acidobacteriota bacterium]|nr:glucosamine-6-phosphate deaminase [Acidobacteriota bacterium]